MKKYIVGFIAGALFVTAVTAFADDIESLVGKSVQGEFTMTVNGKQLDRKAIVIDGSSYAPVRAIGEAVGNEVSFDPDKGITLAKKEGPKVSTPTSTPTSIIPKPSPTIKQQIETLESKINSLAMSVEMGRNVISTKQPGDPKIAEIEKDIAEKQKQIEELMKQREELLKLQ